MAISHIIETMNLKPLILCSLFALPQTGGAQTELAKSYKSSSNGNPISDAVFCADPTAIDYNGRLYVYGTNDHQQYKANKKASNDYGKIKSLVVFSTDDMVNWTFHGTIDVGKVTGWAGQSWAPSAVWRTNDKGKDEFFVYFANGGGSVGVLKSTTSPRHGRHRSQQLAVRPRCSHRQYRSRLDSFWWWRPTKIWIKAVARQFTHCQTREEHDIPQWQRCQHARPLSVRSQ